MNLQLVLDYLTRQQDTEAADLAFDLAHYMDNPLTDVMTGGEVRELCIARNHRQLYQTIDDAALHQTIISRKCSRNSRLYDRESLTAWLAKYDEKQRNQLLNASVSHA